MITAIESTLRFVAKVPSSHVVFDYANPPESMADDVRELHDARAARVAELGEPWVSYFDTAELRTLLLDLGFDEIDDIGPREIVARYLPGSNRTPSSTGGHIVHAAISQRPQQSETHRGTWIGASG